MSFIGLFFLNESFRFTARPFVLLSVRLSVRSTDNPSAPFWSDCPIVSLSVSPTAVRPIALWLVVRPVVCPRNFWPAVPLPVLPSF